MRILLYFLLFISILHKTTSNYNYERQLQYGIDDSVTDLTDDGSSSSDDAATSTSTDDATRDSTSYDSNYISDNTTPTKDDIPPINIKPIIKVIKPVIKPVKQHKFVSTKRPTVKHTHLPTTRPSKKPTKSPTNKPIKTPIRKPTKQLRQ